MSESISLGMYSLNSELEDAWRVLFLTAGKLAPDLNLPTSVVNSIDMDIVTDASTRLSHICGLPLVSQFHGRLMPLCAPHFDVKGIDGAEYFSYFVVREGSHIQSVKDSKGCVVAVNSIDSNSGMSVFRRELRESCNSQQLEFFYRDIVYSGAHADSVQCLISGEADITSIDAVTYAYLQRINPDLDALLRIIGSSVKMTSPPFVTQINNPLCDPAGFTEILNSALAVVSPKQRELLNIKAFAEVSVQSYMPMLAL